MTVNPIESVLSHYPFMTLDGAMATELERKGCNLADPLWSARVLLEQPELIASVHNDYFKAGADCVITASYQATIEGLRNKGLNQQQALQVISSSVSIAKEARDVFWQKQSEKNRPEPLIAASVGPYGAYLADGSEYRGDYTLRHDSLMDFHRQRIEILIAAKPDILACETIPCLEEALALADLIKDYPNQYCWISFTAKDSHHTCNGEPIGECARQLDQYEQVAAIGINCTPPQYVESLINQIKEATTKPIIVYPNSGDSYDPLTKSWLHNNKDSDFSTMSKTWYQAGARIIGGCCRTTPDDIKSIAAWRQSQSL